MVRLKELLTTPSTQLDRASRFVVFQIKLWSHCARLLKKNRSGQQAAALSYHTIFGIVPLAIVTLLIFKSFPAYSEIGEKMKDFVYREAHLTAFKSPAANGEDSEQTEALTDHIDGLVDRFFAETNKGQIGLFSVMIVIWAALSLLTTIEKSFNSIWHVATGRNFLHRITSYWALLTLGPLLVGVGIYIITQREPSSVYIVIRSVAIASVSGASPSVTGVKIILLSAISTATSSSWPATTSISPKGCAA